jgi:hypothetical protein
MALGSVWLYAADLIARYHGHEFAASALRGSAVHRDAEPGGYRVVTDEELIEGISFPVYRRVSTMIFVPAPPAR